MENLKKSVLGQKTWSNTLRSQVTIGLDTAELLWNEGRKELFTKAVGKKKKEEEKDADTTSES